MKKRAKQHDLNIESIEIEDEREKSYMDFEYFST